MTQRAGTRADRTPAMGPCPPRDPTGKARSPKSQLGSLATKGSFIPPYPRQGEVPADGLWRPQGGDAVVRAHPPAQRYLWYCHPRRGSPAWLGCWHVAQHQPCAITPKPAGKRDPRSPHPSSRLLPAVSPSCIDPAPPRRGSAVVIIASILTSMGAVLATALLGALGYGGLLRGLLGGQSPQGPQENTPTWQPHQQRN